MIALSFKKAADFLRSYISRQNWSFPDSIIYYILMNPSNSKVYEKLIQSCKYFFIKNPILVIPKLFIDSKNERKTTFSERCANLYKTASKIWITREISNFGKNIAFSSLIPKIFKSEISELCLSDQNISFDDLKFIAAKCERIWLKKVSVINENDTIISLENIFEILPNVKNFEYRIPDYTSLDIITENSVKKMLQTPHFVDLRYFILYYVPECFDINNSL